MTESVFEYLDSNDPLTQLFDLLKLSTDVYANGHYSGQWAIDTSGTQRIPFHFIASGTASAAVEKAPAVILNEGDLIWFPKDSEHEIKGIGGQCHMICGFFNIDTAAQDWFIEGLPDSIILNTRQDQFSSSLWQKIADEVTEKRPGYTFMINSISSQLMLCSLRDFIVQDDNIQHPIKALFSKRIQPALVVIHKQFDESITIEMLADVCHLSRSSFIKHFKASTGLSPISYLQNWRMLNAKQQVELTDKPLIEIANDVGFSSDTSFRRAFKQQFGINAKQLRLAAKHAR